MARAQSSALKDKLAKATNGDVEVDFSAAREGGGFDAIEPGDYEAEVETCESGTSKAGAPKLVFRFKISEGEEHAGRVFFKHCPTSGDGSGILRDVLKALGFDVDKMTKFSPGDAVGREAVIVIGFQKGADRNDPEALQEIKRVKAIPGAKPVTSRGRGSRSRL